MKKKPFVFALLVLFSLVFAACRSFTSTMKEPVLSLNSLDLADINFTGVDMVARINVENPNSYSIPFPRLDWEFFINADSFIRGTVESGNTLKARQSTVVDVPFSLTYEGIYNTFRSIRGAGEADYVLTLGATFPIPLIQDKTYALRFSGVLPLLRAPIISAPSFAIADLDFTGVGILCTFDVENPNEFPIPSPRIAWDYLVDKTSLAKNTREDPRLLPAKTVSPVDIRVDIDYADLYGAVRSLADSAEAPFVMNLSAAFSLPGLEDTGEALDIAGTIPLLKKPELRFRGVSPGDISLQRAEFVLTWEVENKNNFEMSIEAFDYDFAVNDNQWARGRAAAPPRIGPNKTTAVPLTITINSPAMIRDITDIMSRRANVSYVCGGSVSLSGGPPGLGRIDMPFNFTGTTRLR
jgi:LEA14-like dessication related protein